MAGEGKTQREAYAASFPQGLKPHFLLIANVGTKAPPP